MLWIVGAGSVAIGLAWWLLSGDDEPGDAPPWDSPDETAEARDGRWMGPPSL